MKSIQYKPNKRRKEKRELTVTALTLSNVSPYGWKTTYRVVPAIRLCGKWLAKAGFEIDDKVEVCISDDELLIRRASKP